MSTFPAGDCDIWLRDFIASVEPVELIEEAATPIDGRTFEVLQKELAEAKALNDEQKKALAKREMNQSYAVAKGKRKATQDSKDAIVAAFVASVLCAPGVLVVFHIALYQYIFWNLPLPGGKHSPMQTCLFPYLLAALFYKIYTMIRAWSHKPSDGTEPFRAAGKGPFFIPYISVYLTVGHIFLVTQWVDTATDISTMITLWIQRSYREIGLALPLIWTFTTISSSIIPMRWPLLGAMSHSPNRLSKMSFKS